MNNHISVLGFWLEFEEILHENIQEMTEDNSVREENEHTSKNYSGKGKKTCFSRNDLETMKTRSEETAQACTISL